jgi:16S rRNA (guanine527-N7)-methyltransferase
MNKAQIEILKKEFNITPNQKIIEDLTLWQKLFEEYNAHTNLISKGDLKFIFEKHIFDSLGILKYKGFDISKPLKIVDIGAGGGFPSLILTIFFRNLKIIAVDSVAKKINFINMVKDELALENLKTFASRVENLPAQNADFTVSRAVGDISKIWEYSKKHLKKNGCFLIYKGKNYKEELEEFEKKYNKKALITPYILPTQEKHERFLICISTKGNHR